MRRKNLNADQWLYTTAAFCLVVRSLVAPGLMVVGGAEGFASLSLVLCPSQNTSLDFDQLSSIVRHYRHGLQSHHEHQRNTDAALDAGVHLVSLDSSCGLWA
ncbi:MAG: hypothetical protein O7C67_13985, partial [Gammaproteobacteria bacterium]|nr:hypothetical protein [Gammaproteobacteria bacterium]